MTDTTVDTTSRLDRAVSPEWSLGIANEEPRYPADLEGINLLVEANVTGSITRDDRKNGDSRTYYSKTDQIMLFPPPPTLPQESFTLFQKWEGYVIEIGRETFSARLTPLEGQGSDQIAEIYLDEVGEIDQDLLEPGAVFYWSIGYRRRPSGTKERSSIIRFRRLPNWTRYELKRAERRAQEIDELFEDA
jgi:hypothetical protein